MCRSHFARQGQEQDRARCMLKHGVISLLTRFAGLRTRCRLPGWGILAVLLFSLLGMGQVFATTCNLSFTTANGFTSASGGTVTKSGSAYTYNFSQTDYDNCDTGATPDNGGGPGIYLDSNGDVQNQYGSSVSTWTASTSSQGPNYGTSNNVYVVTQAGSGRDNLIYTPPTGFSGTDTFTFYFSPDAGLTFAVATVTVTVPSTAPTVSGLSPTGGGIAGGTAVTISGTGFTGATAVKFGSTNASSFTVTNDSSISATAPAQSAGSVYVTVTTAQGTNATGGTSQYTYVTPVVAGAATATVLHGSSSNNIALNLSGGAATSVAVVTAPSHGTATAVGTAIHYTPTASYSGSDSFTYTATNDAGTSSSATVTITVSDPTLTISPTSGTTLTGTNTVSYSRSFIPSGGSSPYSYGIVINSGSLPTGLSFSTSTGVLSGTPTSSGTVNFTVTATDSSTGTGPFTVSGTYDLTIAALPAGTITFATPTSATVTLGNNLTNLASSTLSGGSYGAISYSSSDTSVATVNASTGVVTSLSTGSTVITATQAAVAGVNAVASQSYTLTVTALPVGILSFTTPTSASVTMGGALTNSASSTLSGGSFGAISYSSSNTGVATVNSSGAITTISAGTTVITATQAAVTGVNAQATQTYTLTVNPLPVGTLTFATSGSATVALGSTLTNIAIPSLSGGSYGAISYSSANTSIATVNASTGVVTPVSVGTVVITATQAAVAGVNALASQTYSLTVSALPVGTLTFDTQTAASVTMGGTLTNIAHSNLSGGSYGAISYSSANTSVATVNASTGAVTPVSVGTVVITATQAATSANGQASQSYTLTVSALLVGTLTFDTQTAASVTMGSTLTNSAHSTLSGGSYGAISYSSSNTSVATVNASSGVVTPVSVGTAVITAIQAAVAGVNGQATQSYTLTVGANLTSVVLSSSSAAPIQGQSLTLTATITPSSASGSVNFMDGGSSIGHASVSAGHASLVISSFAIGSHALTAAYSGDGNNAAATSAVTTVVVGQRADPTTNALVKQSVTSQVATVQRFSQAQLTNIYSHVQLLHGDFSIRNRMGMGINSPQLNALRSVGGALYDSYVKLAQNQTSSDSSAKTASDISSVLPISAAKKRVVSQPQMQALAPSEEGSEDQPLSDSDVLHIGGIPVGIWSAGSVDIGSMDTQNGGRSKFSSTGLTMGMDMLWNRNLIVGMSLGYAQGKTTMDDLGSDSKSKMWSGSLYATYRPAKKWFIDALLGVGSLGYDNHRWDDQNSLLLSGNRHGTVAYGSFSLTRELELQQFRLHPFGRFDMSQTMLNQYSEAGSIMALTYNKSTYTTTSFTGGLEVFKDFYISAGLLSPSVKLQVTHRTSGDANQSIYYTDMGANSTNYSMLVSSGTPEDVQSFGLALNFKNHYGLQSNLSWLGSIGGSAYRSNSIRLDVRMGF